MCATPCAHASLNERALTRRRMVIVANRKPYMAGACILLGIYTLLAGLEAVQYFGWGLIVPAAGCELEPVSHVP